MSVFPRSQLLIAPYELLKREPLEFLRLICEYLEVSVEPIAGRADKVVYEGPQAPLPDDLREVLADRHRGVLDGLLELCGLDFSDYWSPELQREPAR